MLGEPGRTQYDLNFPLFGFPIRIHPLFWLIAIFMGGVGGGGSSTDSQALLLGLLSWVAAMFLGILVHELGHAVATRYYGFRPWIVLYGFGGVTCYSPAQRDAGKRAPGGWGEILISFAGPLAGFLFAGLLCAALYASGRPITVDFGLEHRLGFKIGFDSMGMSLYFALFVYWFLLICIGWGLLNLLPIYPLDGGQIARNVCLMINRAKGVRWSLTISVLLASLIATYSLLQFARSGAKDYGDLWIGVLFGMLARSSFETLRSYDFHRWDR